MEIELTGGRGLSSAVLAAGTAVSLDSGLYPRWINGVVCVAGCRLWLLVHHGLTRKHCDMSIYRVSMIKALRKAPVKVVASF